MRPGLLSHLLRGNTPFFNRPRLRTSFFVLAAFVALALPLVMLPIGSAQRAGLGKGGDPSASVSNTATYRSPENRHKVQVTDKETADRLASQGARLVGDYSSFKIYEASTELANSLASNKDVQIRDEDNVVQLNAGGIDTTRTDIQARRASVGGFSGKRMHLVQFAGPIKTEWFQALSKTGVEVVSYIPSNAYLVYGDSRQLSRVQALTSVQWEGAYKSEYRVDPSISGSSASSKLAALGKGKGMSAESAANTEGLFAVQLVKDEAANAETLQVIEKLKLEPLKNQYEILNYVNVIVRLNSTSVIGELALRDDVVSIQPWTTPVKLDERQDQIMAGNLTGSSPTPGNYLNYLAAHGFTFSSPSTFGVNVSDSGVDNATTTPNHFALYTLGNPIPANSRVVYNRLEGTPHAGSTLQGCDGHGNLNTHIIGGYVPTGGIFAAFPHADGAGFRYGLGIAPFVKVGSSVIFDPDTFTNPNFAHLESKAYNDGMRLSSNR